MSNKNRSRDATFNLKSCKNRSIQTKQQQSTMKPTPKSTKYTKSNSNKSKKKPINIKSVSKLNQYIKIIENKLCTLNDESTPITLQSSTNASSKAYIGKYKQDELQKSMNLQFNLTTQILLQQLYNCRKEVKSKIQHVQSPTQQDFKVDIFESQNYSKVFNKALSKPHCLRKINLKRKSINRRSSSETNLQQEIQLFKRQQNSNWNSINRELEKYLTLQKDKINKNEQKYISQILKKQGNANYRWIQIQDKMQVKQFKTPQKKKIKVNQIIKNDKNNQITTNIVKDQIDDSPLTNRILLKDYNWQKYIWNDENASSSSELACKSQSQSEQLYLKINPADVVEQTDNIQQNIDLVFNWLVDEFVIQLAEKLDFNMIFKSQENKYESSYLNYENYQAKLATINQIANDCQKIRSVDFNSSTIQQKAIEQVLQLYPQLTIREAKQKLCSMISHRQITAQEIITPQDKQEQQWIRITFISQLQELVWQTILTQQSFRLSIQ